jgi:hypothetical protein
MVSKIGKGTSIVAIIALLLALGASGFIIYDQFTAVPEIQPSSKQYYIYDSSSHYVPGSEVWSIINTMKIDFTINLGQKVYFSYSGMAVLDDSSNDTYIELKFTIDGIRMYYPYIRVDRYNTGGTTGGLRLPISSQYYNTTISPGNHTVTMSYKGDHTLDRIWMQSLFV